VTSPSRSTSHPAALLERVPDARLWAPTRTGWKHGRTADRVLDPHRRGDPRLTVGESRKLMSPGRG
jgi:hypothetical protein